MSERQKQEALTTVVAMFIGIPLWFLKVYIAARIFLYVWVHAATYL